MPLSPGAVIKNLIKNLPTEHEEQCTFIKWFEVSYPHIRYFAVPNGTWARNVSIAKKMKREGQKNGVPDLYFPAWKLWIEMKRKKGGTLSADQKEWRDYLVSIGDLHIVGHGAWDAIEKLKNVIKLTGLK